MSAPALHGLHHVTAVTANARANLDFYTRVLGMRLVKKTVNQDDVSAYHLFYADALGSPGTELTFFDWKNIPRQQHGAGMVSETALRVLGGSATLERWSRWFDENGVTRGDIKTDACDCIPSLPFQDPEGQCLRLRAEPSIEYGSPFHPWRGSPLPLDSAVIGLSSVCLTVRDFETTGRFLADILGFRPVPDHPHCFETGKGGPGTQIRVITSRADATHGAGGVHHVAWAVRDRQEQRAWLDHLAANHVGTSGLVDRFYFQSVYFRIPGGILFEIATEGPGFTADGEDIEHLGERLSLPPFLEKRRAQIEAGLAPL